MENNNKSFGTLADEAPDKVAGADENKKSDEELSDDVEAVAGGNIRIPTFVIPDYV